MTIFEHFQNSKNVRIENVRNQILSRAWKEKNPLTTAKRCNKNWGEKSKLYEVITANDDRDIIVAESGKLGIIFVCDGQSLEVRHVLDITNREDVFVSMNMSAVGNFLVAYVCIVDYMGTRR
jgi:hypothetical protein